MRRYRGIVAYDGTDFSGWQIQPNGPSIQAAIERALARISGETVKVHGSGRTDAGVHARGQVFHFDMASAMAVAHLRRGLNALLPSAIRCASLAIAASDFHARKSAVCKEYRYFIWNAPLQNPFRTRFWTHVPARLDVDAMRRAAQCLVGQYDFAAFCGNPKRFVETTVRDLSRLDVRKRGCELVISAVADGFLYKMVRSLAGFLMRVGSGALAPDAALAIRDSRTRTAVVPTAPPEGLFLWRVDYGDGSSVAG